MKYETFQYTYVGVPFMQHSFFILSINTGDRVTVQLTYSQCQMTTLWDQTQRHLWKGHIMSKPYLCWRPQGSIRNTTLENCLNQPKMPRDYQTYANRFSGNHDIWCTEMSSYVLRVWHVSEYRDTSETRISAALIKTIHRISFLVPYVTQTLQLSRKWNV